MSYIKLRSDLFGITSLLDYRPETAAPLCDLTQILLRGESTLTESERELIASYVSYLNECTFCASAHSQASCLLPGGDAKLIEMMRVDVQKMDISDKLKSLINIAAKVLQGGLFVTMEEMDNARSHGANDKEIHDTVLIAALFCLYNKYVDGLAAVAPEDPAYYEALGRRITSRGYKKPEDGYKPLEVVKSEQ